VYTLADYLWMLADRPRVAAYAAALRAQITPGARVVEVGAGFGFFSVVAALAGASHVDAVETNPVVHLGPKVAAANGCADRIAFHYTDVKLVALARPADVLILDLRGPTPFAGRSLELVMNARDRLLRKGGSIIAARDTMFVAPSRSPAVIKHEVHAARDQLGVILDPVERVISDTPMRCAISSGDLVAPGKAWLELDYRTLDRTAFGGESRWICESRGTIDGLAVWFDSDLGAGVSFSTAPGSVISAYKQLFIPLGTPVDVHPGDCFRIELGVRQARERALWVWRAWLGGSGEGTERQVANQNSMAEMVIDPAAFTITSPDAKPTLGSRGRAVRHLLTRMDGRHSIDHLAAEMLEAAPEVFRTPDSAAEFVAGWIQDMARLERGAE
jgi:hypothetical protein